jgi:ATP-dependent Zn protease
LVIVFSAFLLWQVIKAGSAGQKDKEVNFSQFLTDVDQGNVKEVTINGQEVRGTYRNDNSAFHTTAPSNYPDMIKTLRDKGVSMNIRDITSGSWPLQLLGTWAPLILLAQTRQADREKVHADADAQHREALAAASAERQDLAAQQTAQLLELLEQNTKLTQMTQELTARIKDITDQIHNRVVPQ